MARSLQLLPLFRASTGVRVIALYMAVSGFAYAQTWDGSADSNWSNSANWTPSSTPGYGATVNFDDTPGSDQTVNVGSQRQIAEINIDSQYNYTLSGGTIVFATGTRQLNFDGTGNASISSNIRLSGDTVFNNTGTGTLTLNTGISQWGSSTLFVNGTGTGTTVFNGTINGGIPLQIDGGTNIFNNTINSPSVTISNGTNTFNADFGGGVDFNVTGGDNEITSNIGGGSEINVNVSSGGLRITGDIGGGAVIDVEQGHLALDGNLQHGTITVESGGTLLLDDNFTHTNGGSNVTLNGGTLEVAANDVSFPSLTLNEDSTIDLLDDSDATIYLGTITGDGVLHIVNYQDTQQVTFDSGSSTSGGFVVAEQVYFGNTPGMIDPDNPNRIIPGVTPVPEPGTITAGVLLTAFLGFHFWRRRQTRSIQASSEV